LGEGHNPAPIFILFQEANEIENRKECHGESRGLIKSSPSRLHCLVIAQVDRAVVIQPLKRTKAFRVDHREDSERLIRNETARRPSESQKWPPGERLCSVEMRRIPAVAAFYPRFQKAFKISFIRENS
jgi:hypothetical protein